MFMPVILAVITPFVLGATVLLWDRLRNRGKAILICALIVGYLAACNGGGGPVKIHDAGTVTGKRSGGGDYYLDLHNGRAGYWTERTNLYVYNLCQVGDHWTSDDGCS